MPMTTPAKTVSLEETLRRADWLQSLQMAHNFFEAHPDQIPVNGVIFSTWAWAHEADKTERATRFVRLHGGATVEPSGGSYADLRAEMGPHLFILHTPKSAIGHEEEALRMVPRWEWDVPGLTEEGS
jgi:hypothetical protein